MSDESEIDTMNKYMVAVTGMGVVIMNPPRTPMNEDETLTLAAWLVAVTARRERFDEILKAVEST